MTGADPSQMMATALGGAFDVEKRRSMSWFQSKLEFFREYFNVTHAYVRWKLVFLVFPFMPQSNRLVSRATSREVPHDDSSAEQTGQGSGIGLRLFPGRRPDLYIPIMGYITFVLLHGLSRGRSFHPDDLYNIASLAGILGLLEVLIVKGAAYILNVPNWTLTDIMALCGYKFINLSLTIIALMLLAGTGRAVWVGLWVYAALTAGFGLQKGLTAAGNYTANAQHYMGTGSAGMEKLLAVCAGAAQLFWCWILMPAFTASVVAATKGGAGMMRQPAFVPEATR